MNGQKTEYDDLPQIDEPDLDWQPERIVFIVNTSPEYFRSWLINMTEEDYQQRIIMYPTKRGQFHLAPGEFRGSLEQNSRKTQIVLSGVEFFRTGGGGKKVASIRFTLLPISESRTEVTAECLLQLVLPHFRKLLMQITEAYPETADKIDIPELRIDVHNSKQAKDWKVDDIEKKASNLDEPSPSPTESDNDEQQRLAERAKELGIRQHRLVRWNKMKPLIARGLTQEQIAERLDVSTDTVKSDYRDMREKGVFPI